MNLEKYKIHANIAFLSIFAIFVAHTAYIGGDAFNGYQKDGKYYVNWHGIITETTSSAFATNKALGITLFASTVAYLIFYYIISKKLNNT